MKKKVVNKKILENLVEFILGTSILLLLIAGCLIADWLSQIITIDIIMRFVYIAMPIAILYLIKCDFEERRKKHGHNGYIR